MNAKKDELHLMAIKRKMAFHCFFMKKTKLKSGEDLTCAFYNNVYYNFSSDDCPHFSYKTQYLKGL